MTVICNACQRSMILEVAGVVVIKHAIFGPYKLWHADQFWCPRDGTRVVAQFADRAYAEHYQTGFAAYLTMALAGPCVHWFESLAQRETWEKEHP